MALELTPAAAHACLQAVRAREYAATRNHVDGAVTRLSPFITHGLLGVAEVLAHLREREPEAELAKLVFQLGWREYFRHVWRHRGDAIGQSFHPGPLPDAAYARTLPADIARGATGLPVIDQAVRELHQGWLHNHARLWLASYVVHLRKVHWRTGAEWMVSHLLDGDLASNHLSWQWVAGTSSARPYLFNAENVRRHAPPAWHVDGTALDTRYEALAEVASGQRPWPDDVRRAAPGDPPPPVHAAPPELRFDRATAAAVAGRDVWLVHPWSLADPPRGRLRLAVLDAGFHAAHPWSAARWQAVGARLQAISDLCWLDSASAIVTALRAARSVGGRHDPHLDGAFDAFALAPPVAAFPDPDIACHSFSAWWGRVANAQARPKVWHR